MLTFIVGFGLGLAVGLGRVRPPRIPLSLRSYRWGLCLILLSATTAFAQSPNCNPYATGPAADACHTAPQPDIPGCVQPYAGAPLICSVPGGVVTLVKPNTFLFGEGVVHAPGSELAWVILTNFDTEPQIAHVELLVSGRPPITRDITVAGKERKDLSLHDLPELSDIATFSTSVSFPLSSGHASLVMRPLADAFSRVTLPPPTVVR